MLRLLAFLVFVCVLLPVTEAGAATTCRSGKTQFSRDGVRVFSVSPARKDEITWYACGPNTRRPVELFVTSSTYGTRAEVRPAGDRLAFIVGGTGEGGGESVSVGWFDPRTSEIRSGELANNLPGAIADITMDASGGLALVSGGAGGGFRVGYLRLGRRRGALIDELVLSVLGSPYVRGSLAFAGRSVTWKEQSGLTRSVPVTGEPVSCSAGVTLAESEGTRIFNITPARKGSNGFQIDQLMACTPGATQPVVLQTQDMYNSLQWTVRALRRAGARVAFLAGSTTVGVIDAGTARVYAEPEIDYVVDVAIGIAGPPVIAASTEGSLDAPLFVGSLAADAKAPTRFAPVQRLAMVAGTFEPGSLAVGDDGRVTWRTKEGRADGVPVAGETSLTCTAGTTLLEANGVRVFGVLPAGGKDARLLACAAGAAQPIPLLTGVRDAIWRVVDLGRDGDRSVVYVNGRAGTFADRVVSFGTAVDSVRAGLPGPSMAYSTIRDTAIAPDGRVAVALRDGRRWRVTVFRLGAAAGTLRRERIVASPRDGVKAGSLAFSPDGSRLTWRSRAGRARGVAL